MNMNGPAPLLAGLLLLIYCFNFRLNYLWILSAAVIAHKALILIRYS